MRWLKRLLVLIHWVENTLLVGFMLTMIGLAVLQIVLRNGFDGGILWAAPFLRVLVLWIAMLGAVVASRDQRHIRMDLLSHFLPAVGRRVVTVITGLATTGICLLLAKYSFDFVRMEYEAPSMAFGQVPTWVCEGIMPVAFSLIALRYGINAVKAVFFDVPPEHSVS